MTKPSVQIIYDGDCPFCQAYVKMLRIKEQYEVELINAREPHPAVEEVNARQLDLDEGMVVKLEGEFYHGADAMQRMALMSAKSGLLRNLTQWIFKSPFRSRFLYPILRTGRAITLAILGHKKIRNLEDLP